jgi:hypothetical protein
MSYTRVTGWLDYNDTSTTSTPIALVADTFTDVPNDGLGSFTNKAYPPLGVGELIDTSTGYLDFSSLRLGDVIVIRNDFTVTPQTNNSELRLRYVLGGGAGEYALTKSLGRLDRGAGVGYNFSLGVDLIYMGDTNTKGNPGKLQIELSTTGTAINNGSVISVSRYTA